MIMSLKIVLLVLSLMVVGSVAEVSFVTQEQFELFNTKFQDQAALIQQLAAKTQQQDVLIQKQATTNQQLVSKVAELDQSLTELQSSCLMKHESQSGDLQQNITIEERVTILETEMGYVLDELNDIETDVDFLFYEQVIQDQNILVLQQETGELDSTVEDLQIRTLTLENRVSILEENGADNSSVVELEVRVTELEDETSQQEARIVDNTQSIEVLESNVTQSLDIRVTTLEGDVADQEGRIVANTQSIGELESADVDLDVRVSTLEENVAFHAVLTSYSSISTGSPVPFNVELEDTNNGFGVTTFTVPSGADGLYYFSTYLAVGFDELGVFDIQVNGVRICTARGDANGNSGTDAPQGTCSAVVSLVEDDEVQVIYREGTNTTPLLTSSSYYYSGFTGFRL